MALLQPAVSTSAFLKMGIMGFQGGGKTLTSAKVLIGLYKYTQKLGLNDGSKPVAMLDTEKGSDWLIPIFKAAGVPFVVAKRKTFSDMLKVMDEAEAAAFGLLIDSITHPWRELVESYLRKKERSYLAMDDWGYLKGEHGWQQFTDRYINSKLHIVMAGRAGFEYENYVEDGRKKMEKVGTKMKTEGETGYEPDLLVLMQQIEDVRTNQVVHRAIVQKDRSTALDGQEIDNPDFDSFLPHIERLALGGAHVGVAPAGDSQHHIKLERKDWSPVQRRICIDEIQTLLSLHHPGSTAAEKTAKLKLVLKHFNTVWTEIEEVMPLPDLRAGYNTLHQELEGKPSKYGTIVKAEGATVELNDSLPDHSSAEGAAKAAAQPELTLEQKLIVQLEQMETVAECQHFAVDVTNRHREALGEDGFNRINTAMMQRQAKIAKKAAPQEGGAKPDTPKDGGTKADLSAVDPKTGAPAFLTREPETAKPKAKGKSGGGDSEATNPLAPALQADAGGMYGLISV